MRARGLCAAVALFGLSLVAGCRSLGSASTERCRADERLVVSNLGSYLICFKTDPPTIPLNEPFTLEARIFQRAPRPILARAIVLEVDAQMPAHRHGLIQPPQLIALNGPAVQDVRPGHGVMSDGLFRAGGMLFHMPGLWELEFDISRGAVTERGQLDVELE